MKVRKAGNNVVVNYDSIEEFMYRFFEMERVKGSYFRCGDFGYEMYSYHETDDMKTVKMISSSDIAVLDSFEELKKDYPSIFTIMEEGIIYFIL